MIGNGIEKNKKSRVRFRQLSISLLLVLCILAGTWLVVNDSENVAMSTKPKRGAYDIRLGVLVDSLDVKSFKVKSNQTLSDILLPYGVSFKEIYDLSIKDKKQFDVRSIKAGNEYTIMTRKDDSKKLEHFIYCRSLSEYVVCSFVDSIQIATLKKKIRTERKRLSFRIDNSLYLAVSKAGGLTGLSPILSDIYQWSIDFYGIQKGDSVTVIYDEQFVDTTSVGVDKIIAAKFTHAENPYYAIGYEDGDKSGFWNEDGESLRKSFLMAPLKFSRISSKYSNARMHPVLRIVRPHRGIDYAAPSGTPVWSVADGVVTRRSYDKGNGNIIKIKHSLHNGRYETGYLHLRSFAKGIKVGSRVKQGQIIAYVGSTGISTGPHLDYRIWRNGKNINPLSISQEKGTPISKGVKDEYSIYKDSVINILDAVGGI